MNIGDFFGKIIAQRLDDDVFGVEMSRVKDADAGCCGSQIFVLLDLRGQQASAPAEMAASRQSAPEPEQSATVR